MHVLKEVIEGVVLFVVVSFLTGAIVLEKKAASCGKRQAIEVVGKEGR